MKTLLRLRSYLLVPIAGFMPLVAQAQTQAPPIQPRTGFRIEDIVGILNVIANWFLAIISVVAVIMILWGAFRWMTAGGNEEQATEARKIVIYGLIGIAIAILAWSAVTIVASLLGT